MNVLSAVSLHHLPTKLPSQQILQDFCVCEFMLISVMSDCFVYHSVCACVCVFPACFYLRVYFMFASNVRKARAGGSATN